MNPVLRILIEQDIEELRELIGKDKSGPEDSAQIRRFSRFSLVHRESSPIRNDVVSSSQLLGN